MNHNQTQIIRGLIRETLGSFQGEINLRGPLVELITPPTMPDSHDINGKDELIEALGLMAWDWAASQADSPLQEWKRLVIKGPILVEARSRLSKGFREKLDLPGPRSESHLTGAWRIILTPDRVDSDAECVVSRISCAVGLKHPETGSTGNATIDYKRSVVCLTQQSDKERWVWVTGRDMLGLVAGLVRIGPEGM